ncbi:hypothetical protein TNCV_937611 [Trichonephila clavipes]|nr:hypothetical protein TNCV_937611 [Trichonephila clavipes]
MTNRLVVKINTLTKVNFWSPKAFVQYDNSSSRRQTKICTKLGSNVRAVYQRTKSSIMFNFLMFGSCLKLPKTIRKTPTQTRAKNDSKIFLREELTNVTYVSRLANKLAGIPVLRTGEFKN